MLTLLTSAAVLLNILLILLCALTMLHIKGRIDHRNKEDKEMNTLKIKKLHPDAITPTRSHSTDAGLDLYALEDTAVLTNTTDVIRTGIAVDVPPGYEAQVRPRSGVSLNTNFKVVLGTVDSGYTGEIKIILQNFQDPYLEIQDEFIGRGVKIAQLVISPIVTPSVEIVEEFESESERGNRGFGSTDAQ